MGFDFETASADRNYFRTSLQDYQKLRARARYQILQSLSLSANFSLLNNLNPSVQNRNEFRSREDSTLGLLDARGREVDQSAGGLHLLHAEIQHLLLHSADG